MYIMSGYRSEELNRLVGGAPSSQHMKGEAVDIYTVDRNRLLEDLVASRLNFDQAILYRTKGFIHLSLKNRHKAQRKAKFYINKCRSASCMQSGLKQASA